MNQEPIVFTDIFPVWELPWYQTPGGSLIIGIAILLILVLGGAIWFWRKPYRKMNRLARLMLEDAEKAPDYCALSLKLLCAIHKIPVDEQMTEQDQIGLLKNRFPHSEWDFLQQTLIRARYAHEKVLYETRKRWVDFLRESARSLRH
jgi:hypothetical protein